MKKRLLLISALAAILTFLVPVANAQTRPRRTPVRKALPTGAVKTPSGLTYIITNKGAGLRPKVGDTVVVHYTGTLTNGIKFDSSRDSGRPISFPLGKGRVIKGWDEGLAKLHIGDRAIFIIPPSLGYGERGSSGVIPPNATLIFVVELMDINPK